MADSPAREGSLEAPFRHPIEWRSESYYDLSAIEAEMERVFDVCHTCRRCFNLCDSFPRLFDLIDESASGEVDGVAKADYGKVVEACTLCDMCFMTKCPYVPPHPFDIDFPHLMLRRRAADRKQNGGEFVREQLGETDRNGKLAKPVAPLINLATSRKAKPIRAAMEAVAGIDRDAELPKWSSKTPAELYRHPPPPNPEGPAFGKRKAVIYTTCFANYNETGTATDAMSVLLHQGVETKFVYPVCCGMPQLEAGDLAEVAARAEKVAAEMASWIAGGWDVVAVTASCGLMMKFEWPLLLPEHAGVKALSAAAKDICEYVVDLSKAYGLTPGLEPLRGVTIHHACHARAQNMGAKSAEMLRLIPDTQVDLVERCSGHGGTFGVMKETHGVAVKVGKPAARQVAKAGNKLLCSDCPLACKHIGQLLEAELPAGERPHLQAHPITMMAYAYDF